MIETYQPKTLARNMEAGIECINKSGEEMPSFAAMMVYDEVDGIYYVKKPDEDSAKEVLFGPSHAVPNNGIFYAVSPYDELCACSDTTTPGDEVGTVSGSWELSVAQSGFAVISGSGGAVRCRPFRSTVSESVRQYIPFSGSGTLSPISDGGAVVKTASLSVAQQFGINRYDMLALYGISTDSIVMTNYAYKSSAVQINLQNTIRLKSGGNTVASIDFNNIAGRTVAGYLELQWKIPTLTLFADNAGAIDATVDEVEYSIFPLGNTSVSTGITVVWFSYDMYIYKFTPETRPDL